MKKSLAAWAVTTVFLLSGCAATQVEFTGVALKAPLCQAGAPPVATAFYWGPKWRPDQKEPELREAAALRGIRNFLDQAGCVAVADLRRLPIGEAIPSDTELLGLAAASSLVPERIVFVLVRELGPRLEIGIPVIVQGGTEVLIEVRVLDARSTTRLADARTLWRNGGTFVIKGVKTLDKDMSAALAATLMPAAVE
jgi:hypothetical protein